MVMDGSGRSGFRADVAIDDDRIEAVGDLSGRVADTDIDVTGRVVAPGFIDVHTHDDRMVRDAGDMTPKVSQGVTTVVVAGKLRNLARSPGGGRAPHGAL